MPAAANLSMLGVRYLRLLSVGSLVNGTEVSCQPMSSTMNSTIFGRCLAVGLGGYGSHGRGHRSQGCECDIAVGRCYGTRISVVCNGFHVVIMLFC